MKFFIPFAENDAEAEAIYADIRRFVVQMTHRNLSDQRFNKIVVDGDSPDGELKEIRVGMKCFVNDEVVIAILSDKNRRSFLICTPSRGIERDRPIAFKERAVQQAELFD